MLYLEDFLELIENLPSELRDRFTEIRTLDLQVQNALDKADKTVHDFFKIAPSLTTDDRHRQFEKIKDDYRKILEDSDEKVNLASMMHDLVRRYLAKLDQEISKFKMELEADSPGLTEILEKKVKEAEQSGRVVKKEKTRKRKLIRPIMNGDWAGDPSLSASSVLGSGDSSRNSSMLANQITVSYGGAQGNYFKKSQSYPNRLADVRTLTVNGQQMSVREKAPNASGSFLQSFTEHPESRHGRPRKLTSRVSEMLRDVIQKQEQREIGSSINLLMSGSSTDDADAGVDGNDMSDQSDQQRWCICNRVSFGAMVACDDKDCPFEWFHYECVGITQPPKGKWFCPHCIKRRK